MLRDMGVHHSELIRDGIAFAVRRMTIDFAAAAHIDDELEVVTEVVSATGARLNLSQSIRRGGTEIARGEVQVVSIKVTGGAARMPKALLALIVKG
jgi:acyl-CoA thioester hydrolase